MNEESYIFMMIASIFFVSLLVLIFSVSLIILRGLGFMQLIKNNNLGDDKVVLGFIPIISDYMLDEVVTGKKSFKENTLGSFTFATGILSVIFGIFSLIYSVSYLILCHKFFKEVSPENYVLLNIFNVLTFGSLSYVYIYLKRNHIFKYSLEENSSTMYLNKEDIVESDNVVESEKINLSK